MGLLDIFKRKEKFDINNSPVNELIKHGLLFEDVGKFIPWGSRINLIANTIEVKEKLFADRAVYTWGERTILDGLTLPLTTTFWYHKEDSAEKKFKSVNFTADGNEAAVEYFELIKNNLEKIFQQSVAKEVTETSTYLEWITGDVKLSLYLYEKYEVKKLQFDITRL